MLIFNKVLSDVAYFLEVSTTSGFYCVLRSAYEFSSLPRIGFMPNTFEIGLREPEMDFRKL